MSMLMRTARRAWQTEWVRKPHSPPDWCLCLAGARMVHCASEKERELNLVVFTFHLNRPSSRCLRVIGEGPDQGNQPADEGPAKEDIQDYDGRRVPVGTRHCNKGRNEIA